MSARGRRVADKNLNNLSPTFKLGSKFNASLAHLGVLESLSGLYPSSGLGPDQYMCWMIWGHKEASGLILGSRWPTSQSLLVMVTAMTIRCLDSPPSLFFRKQHLDFLLGNFLSLTPSPFSSVGFDLTPSYRWELMASCLATPAERETFP